MTQLFIFLSNLDTECTLFEHVPFTEAPSLPQLPPIPPQVPIPKPTVKSSTSPTAIPTNPSKVFPTRKLGLAPEDIDSEITQTLDKEESFPNNIPIKENIGKTMFLRTFAKTHKAASMINAWGHQDCLVDCGKDWSVEHTKAALCRGLHKSAKAPEAIQALIAETTEKIKSGYARIVTWKQIKHNLPPKLKISPVAMVLHKSRKFQTILDLSFCLRHKGTLLPSVNSKTKKLAPEESMI